MFRVTKRDLPLLYQYAQGLADSAQSEPAGPRLTFAEFKREVAALARLKARDPGGDITIY